LEKRHLLMSLAVVLLNWHQEQQTLRCARAVTSWQVLKPYLIVVDNETTEATRTLLSASLSVSNVIFSGANLGYGGGNNLGIESALRMGLKYVLLLNTDAEISPAAVSRLIDRLEMNPEISILGPIIEEPERGGTRHFVGGRDIARHVSTRIVAPPHKSAQQRKDVQEVDYVPGTVFLARTSVFKEIGLLDQEYFFSGEIADFCNRARNRGHRICVDLEVEARHDPYLTPIELRETLYIYYGLRNRFLYITKHYARKKMIYFAFWTIIGTGGLARAIWQRKKAKAWAIVSALMHAYRGRYGDQNAAFLCISETRRTLIQEPVST
jgi:GT2 family glycosyltransferase